MPGWPGHSFTHLSRFASIFRSAVRHCLNTSRRVTLIAASAIATRVLFTLASCRVRFYHRSPLSLFRNPPRYFVRAFFISRNRNRSCMLLRAEVIYGRTRTTVGIEHKLWPIFYTDFYLHTATERAPRCKRYSAAPSAPRDIVNI